MRSIVTALGSSLVSLAKVDLPIFYLREGFGVS